MQLNMQSPATLAGVNGAKSKARSRALQCTESSSAKRKKQVSRRFDDTQKQVNSLKLAAALLQQRPAPAPKYRALPNLKRLNELFVCDPKAGHLIRITGRGGRKAGSVAGLKAPEKHGGYSTIYVDGVGYRAHRLIFKMVHGRDPIGQIDHISGVRSQNKIDNLREVTPLQNSQNRSDCSSNTAHLGVSFCTTSGLYLACIGANNKTVHLGKYARLECAVKARKHAEGILFDLPKPIARAA